MPGKKRWHVKEGSDEYERIVDELLTLLERANHYLDMHPDKQGIFAGRKKTSQEKQRV
jgi:hypothetical protein